MDILAFAVVAVLAAILSLTLKRYNPEYSVLISLVAGVLMLVLLLDKVTPVVSQIQSLLRSTGISGEYGQILFKVLGMCFLCQFSADSCRDAGETALASKVELAGKVFILVASLPLFEEILTTALGLIGG